MDHGRGSSQEHQGCAARIRAIGRADHGLHVRITKLHTPGSARSSIFGLRVLGSVLGAAPAAAKGIIATRNVDNGRRMFVSWQSVSGAKGYLVRYGLAADRLYDHMQVIGSTSVEISDLNLGVSYVLTVDRYNDNGVTPDATDVAVP